MDSAIVFSLWYFIIERWGIDTSESGKILTGFPGILLVVGTAAFWIVPEWLVGATFGKWACDLRVVNMMGRRISLAQSLKRNLLRLLDFFPWYLTGFIAAKLSPNRQRLGDLWAKTLVVKGSDIRHQAAVASNTSPVI